MKKNLILDFDDTLCSFIKFWLIWMYENGYTPVLHTSREVLNYHWCTENYGMETTNFWLEDPLTLYSTVLQPYPQAAEFLTWCQKYFNVSILTLATKPETAQAKKLFCDKYLNFTDINFFDKMEDKYLFTKDAILVDDLPTHCIKHSSVNKCPSIIFNYENQNGWSNFGDYWSLIKEYPPTGGVYAAANYEEVKEILKYHI